MKIGAMRHRVTFQAQEVTQGRMGEVIREWRDVATVWADIRVISGRELLSSGTVYSEATVRIWTRFRPGISTANRILYRSSSQPGTVYAILAVIPDSAGTRLELLCKGGVAEKAEAAGGAHD
ncbi:phage head closure protein [Salmonella enterica subsp. enterica]|nr:phage head closure protein [Salmonella enterica]EKC4132776.1 phage head closure protein [Salmonella enterica subsp. enterica]EKC4151427.1 phage head closure protein [Salmonella enterica subsp. enterica]